MSVIRDQYGNIISKISGTDAFGNAQIRDGSGGVTHTIIRGGAALGDYIVDGYGNRVAMLRDGRIFDSFGNWIGELRGDRVYSSSGNWLYTVR